MPALSLDDLRSVRDALQEFCRLDAASIWKFHVAENSWFGLSLNDSAHQETDANKHVAHLTTTLTCLEALGDRPVSDADIQLLSQLSTVQALGSDVSIDASPVHKQYVVTRRYADLALQYPGEWRSDGAAFVYCRVRTLGALLRLLPSDDPILTSRAEQIRLLLAQAWSSHVKAGTFGLRESSESEDAFAKWSYKSLRTKLMEPESPRTYIPNAFLTYWGLLALDQAPVHLRPSSWEADVAAARDWLAKGQAQQIAFHYSGSRLADPQQLVWSVCAQFRFATTDDVMVKTTVEYAQLTASLAAFFEQQEGDGSWSIGQPLFHYPHAGNAYCYIFETLAELLSLAVKPSRRAAVLRAELKPYGDQLRRLFALAENTSQALDTVGEAQGWSSGHNARRVHPEAWATASVFRFAQALRRIVGMWASEAAREMLHARPARKGLQDLERQGGTWDIGRGSAGALLSTGFINPIKRHEVLRAAESQFAPDPDAQVVPENAASSAILFGPPGTGKTTLVEAVAGALDWPFIEINPGDLLDQGVAMVSAQADGLFQRIMQLDRCVVLLDEIDELIRSRNDSAESVERMFTTTMLPRLTRLWNSKRILFFVNTNSILDIDPAIRRNQRFDMAIFVLPPGWKNKHRTLSEYGVTLAELTEQQVAQAIKEGRGDAKAWYALLTYPQSKRLASTLSKRDNGDVGQDIPAVTTAVLTNSLDPFITDLKTSDWAAEDKSDGAAAADPWPKHFDRLTMAQRRDPDVRLLARVDDEAVHAVTAAGLAISPDGYVAIPDVDDPDAWAGSIAGLYLRPDGVLSLDT